MQQIEIQCFADVFACQLSSPAARLLIDQSANTVWQILIHNRGELDCQLQVQLLVHQADEHSFQLQVSDNQQILYQGAWTSAARAAMIASPLPARQTQTLTYHFDLDQQPALNVDFDLDFIFDCMSKEPSGEVLAGEQVFVDPTHVTIDAVATSAATPVTHTSVLTLLVYSGYFLLLCGLTFFVIMKFIHAKKKASSQQHSS